MKKAGEIKALTLFSPSLSYEDGYSVRSGRLARGRSDSCSSMHLGTSKDRLENLAQKIDDIETAIKESMLGSSPEITIALVRFIVDAREVVRLAQISQDPWGKIDALRVAVKISPDYVWGRYYLATACREVANIDQETQTEDDVSLFKEAREQLEFALESNPGQVLVRYELGILYAKVFEDYRALVPFLEDYKRKNNKDFDELLRLAEVYRELDNPTYVKQALRLYDHCLKQKPLPSHVLYSFGIMQWKYCHKPDLAKTFLEQAHRADRSNPNIVSDFSLLLIQHFNDIERAQRLCDECLPHNPRHIGLKTTAALLYERAGNLSRSFQMYEEVIRFEPQNLVALIGLANAYHKDPNKRKLACRFYERILKQPTLDDSKRLKLLWNYAELLTKPEVEDILKARDLVEQALNIDRQSLMKDENIKHCRLIYEKTIAMDPKEVNARINLGVMMFKFWNELANARKLLEDAIALEPGHASALWFLGQLYVKQKYFELGVQTYETALEHSPPNEINILYELAEIYELDIKDHNEAYKYYLKILDHPRATADNLYNSGRFFQRVANKMDLAKHSFERCIRLQKDHLRALFRLGDILANQYKDHFAARNCWIRVLKLNPTNDMLYKIGRYFEKSDPKDYDRSRQAYERILQTEPDSISTNFYLAELYQHVFKETTLAKEKFDRVLKLKPDSEKLFLIGRFYEVDLGDVHFARNVYENILKNHPNAKNIFNVKFQLACLLASKFHELKTAKSHFLQLLNMDLARDELYMVARWFEKTDNDKAVARRIYQLCNKKGGFRDSKQRVNRLNLSQGSHVSHASYSSYMSR